MIFDELEILYSENVGDLSINEFNARRIAHATDEFEIALKREHNDQAYFQFIFTKLEKRFQDLYDILIDIKILTVLDNKELNSWRIITKKRLELMDKV